MKTHQGLKIRAIYDKNQAISSSSFLEHNPHGNDGDVRYHGKNGLKFCVKSTFVKNKNDKRYHLHCKNFLL